MKKIVPTRKAIKLLINKVKIVINTTYIIIILERNYIGDLIKEMKWELHQKFSYPSLVA